MAKTKFVHYYHPLTTAVDGQLIEISSQTPQFTIAESIAITSGYVSLRECTLPTRHQRMRDEIIFLSANSNDQ